MKASVESQQDDQDFIYLGQHMHVRDWHSFIILAIYTPVNSIYFILIRSTIITSIVYMHNGNYAYSTASGH